MIAVGSQGKGLCLLIGPWVKKTAAEVTRSWWLVFRAREKFTLWGWAAALGGKPHQDWFAEYMRILSGDGGYLRNPWERETELRAARWGGRSEPVESVVFTATWFHRLMEPRTSQLAVTVLRFLMTMLGYLRLLGQLHSFLRFWTCSESDSLRVWSDLFQCVEASLLDLIYK